MYGGKSDVRVGLLHTVGKDTEGNLVTKCISLLRAPQQILLVTEVAEATEISGGWKSKFKVLTELVPLRPLSLACTSVPSLCLHVVFVSVCTSPGVYLCLKISYKDKGQIA